MTRLAPTPRAQRISRAGFICIFYGALLGAAIVVGYVRHHVDVFVSSPGHRPLLGVAIGLAIGIVSVFITRYLTHVAEWARVLHHEFHALVHGIGSAELLLLAASSSVAEEAFFRGALQPIVGVVPQAIIFAGMHFRPSTRFLPWTLMSFIVGVGFGLLAQWLGDLSGPIVAHFTINALNLRYISRTELRA